MSLRTKVTLMILGPAIVIIAVSSLLHYQREREEAGTMRSNALHLSFSSMTFRPDHIVQYGTK